MNKNRALPSKEAGLFKELLTLYETRQLKKGIKIADQILKKFPEHGETLAMKGLVMSTLGDSVQGVQLVKQGVRNDLTSHICWHVFGIIQKADKNYDEALKSYLQALKFDRDNLNLLRDTAQLQVHLRLFDNLVDTRATLLKLRPTFRSHWLGLAVAYHLNGNPTQAANVMQAYHRILKNVPAHNLNTSDTTLYHISLLILSDQLDAALLLLDSSSIIDKTRFTHQRAVILTKLGRTDEADNAWKVLLQLNPNSREYLTGYLSNLGVTTTSQILSVLPKNSPLAERVALSVAEGDTFTRLATDYILRGLKKGIPSLFVDLKSLYPQKRSIIQSIAESALESESDPSVHLWTLYFLAQHHAHTSEYTNALEYIDRAIKHTPSLPDLHTLHARILKRLHNPLKAAQACNAARLLDGQDRFLNTKTVKYLLRANLITQAQSIAGLFTKKDAGSPQQDLEDMQSLLYLSEEAKAQLRIKGGMAMALKRFVGITKIY